MEKQFLYDLYVFNYQNWKKKYLMAILSYVGELFSHFPCPTDLYPFQETLRLDFFSNLPILYSTKVIILFLFLCWKTAKTKVFFQCNK